jgi:4-amino-4-deoxy-L-arabinose transferase-like glycosyltransferase
VTRASFARAAWAIALGALVLRVGYVFALGAHPPLGKDGTWYALQAGTIANGVGYVDPGRYFGFHGAVSTAGFPPLWPGFLALVYDLGLHTLRDFRLTGGVIGAGTVVMTAYLGRRIVNARVGLIAAAIVAISPYMIAADASLMAESLFIALVTGAVLVAVRARESPRLVWFAVLGALLGLATLTRSDGLIIAIVLVGVTAWCIPGAIARRLGLGALALVVTAIVLVPWNVRNTQAMGEPVFLSTNSGSLLTGANCGYVYSGRDIAGWDLRCAARLEHHGKTEVARSAWGRDTGLTYARNHLGKLAVVVPLRVVRGWGLWNPSRLADTEVIESRNRTMQLAGWPGSIVLLALAVGGGVVLVRKRAKVAPLFAVIGAASLVLAVSWGNQRFRLVAEPALAVLAAAMLTTLWGYATARRERSGDTPASQPLT